MKHKTTTERIKKSMKAMFILRPLSALAGLFVLILLSRLLPQNDYGVYFSVWAVVEIAILASNFGLIHSAYRYISAIENDKGIVVPKGPVWTFVSLRVLTLISVAITLWMLLMFQNWAPDFGFVINDVFLKYLLLIIFFEGLARFIEIIFDAMLCQSRSQLSLVSRTVFRLIGITIAYSQDILNIQNVLFIEVLASLFGACLSLYMLVSVSYKSKKDGQSKSAGKDSFWKMFHFSFPGFIAQVLTLVYGPDALKLILANKAGIQELALFGFAYAIGAVVQRYIPAVMLGGVFRPIFVTASKREDSNRILSELFNLSVKINLIVILPIFCFVYISGASFLADISGGMYLDAGFVLSIIIFSLVLVSVHQTFSMFCLAKETSWPVLFSTAISSIGFPLGMLLAGRYGAEGVATTLLISETVWCASCYFIVKCYLNIDWLGFSKLFLSVIVAVSVSYLTLDWTDGYFIYIPALLCPLLFLILVYFLNVFSDLEMTWLKSIFPVEKIFMFMMKFNLFRTG